MILSLLVKVTDSSNAPTPVARAVGGRYNDEIDQDLLKKLMHPELFLLYGEFLSWEPKPELATYDISIMKHYLLLLVHFQEHRMCWVAEKINRSLFHWICNQKTYYKWYKMGMSSSTDKVCLALRVWEISPPFPATSISLDSNSI
jgi:hypothetical protein